MWVFGTMPSPYPPRWGPAVRQLLIPWSVRVEGKGVCQVGCSAVWSEYCFSSTSAGRNQAEPLPDAPAVGEAVGVLGGREVRLGRGDAGARRTGSGSRVAFGSRRMKSLRRGFTPPARPRTSGARPACDLPSRRRGQRRRYGRIRHRAFTGTLPPCSAGRGTTQLGLSPNHPVRSPARSAFPKRCGRSHYGVLGSCRNINPLITAVAWPTPATPWSVGR